MIAAFPPWLRAAVPGTSFAFPHVPLPTDRAPTDRRVPAATPAVALATPTIGPSSITAALATTAARHIRLRIATPHFPDGYPLATRVTADKPSSSA